MPSNQESGLERRDYLKRLGVAAGASTGLAGCLQSLGWGEGGGDEELLLWSFYANLDHTQPWIEGVVEETQDAIGANVSRTDFAYPDLRENFISSARQGNPDVTEAVDLNYAEYTNADLLEPLDEHIEDWDPFDDIRENVREAMTVDGSVYGIPFYTTARALLYRKDILEKYGFEPPETGDEMLEIAQTISAEEEGMYGFNNATEEGAMRIIEALIAHVKQHYDHMYDPDGDGGWELVPDAETFGKQLDTFYYRPYHEGSPTAANRDNRGTSWEVNDFGFLEGDHAMIEMSAWVIDFATQIRGSDQAAELLEENVGVTHLPYTEGGQQASLLKTHPFVVNKHADNTDHGWELVKNLTKPESIERLGEVSPGMVSAPIYDSVDPAIEHEELSFFDEIVDTASSLRMLNWGPVMEAIWDVSQQVIYDEADPYTAGEELHERLIEVESDI